MGGIVHFNAKKTKKKTKEIKVEHDIKAAPINIFHMNIRSNEKHVSVNTALVLANQ